MQKIACYFMNRNVYTRVAASLKSLLKNGNIDRVYLFAEDDDLGFDLPSRVIVQDVSEYRKLLDPDGPNYNCRWTYMILMKVLVCKMLPKASRALTLDLDTIVRGDLSGLWDLNLDNYYFAGVREPFWTQRLHRDYVNAGVLFWNLDKMRDGMADHLLNVLNRMKYTFPEQDCLNDICRGRFLVINGIYNAGDWTEAPDGEIKIRHYMATKGLWAGEPEVVRYGRMSWEDVFR